MSQELFDQYGHPIRVLTNPDCPGDLFDQYGRPHIIVEDANGNDIAPHFTDLDAHMADIFQLFRTGQYIMGIPISSVTTIPVVADRLYAFPFLAARDITIDRIAIRVTNAGATDKDARLGIYNNGANLHPGTLLLDAGTVDVDSIGVKAITISQALTKGLYWFACISDGTPTLQRIVPSISPFGLEAGNLSDILTGWWIGQGYGALPDPFPTSNSITCHVPQIVPRLSSLD